MTGQLLIRAAREEDIPALAAIYAADEFGHGDSADPALLPAYRRAFRAIEESPNEDLYVAEKDGIVVGTFQTLMTTTLTGRGTLSMIVEAVQRPTPIIAGRGSARR